METHQYNNIYNHIKLYNNNNNLNNNNSINNYNNNNNNNRYYNNNINKLIMVNFIMDIRYRDNNIRIPNRIYKIS